MQITLDGALCYIPLHVALFVLFPLLLRTVYAGRYSVKASPVNGIRVSVLVPEHGENVEVFERCLRSIVDNNPFEVVVVHDDGNCDIAEIARRYGAKVVSLPRRVGKRAAMVIGWRMAQGDVIVHVDSDVTLRDEALSEIVKPFSDGLVVGVQGRIYARRAGSWLAWRLSQLIEQNRDLVCRALNGHLVVVDGRFNAWRKSWLLQHASKFSDERFLGKRCEIGEDRFLTWKANAEGYRTVYQSTASAESISPSTLEGFFKQQLRWIRGGFRGFLQEVCSGSVVKAPLHYTLLQLSYYVGPPALILGVVSSVLWNESANQSSTLAGIVTLALILVSLTVAKLSLAPSGLKLSEFLVLSVLISILVYPLAVCAMLTLREQAAWMTR